VQDTEIIMSSWSKTFFILESYTHILLLLLKKKRVTHILVCLEPTTSPSTLLLQREEVSWTSPSTHTCGERERERERERTKTFLMKNQI